MVIIINNKILINYYQAITHYIPNLEIAVTDMNSCMSAIVVSCLYDPSCCMILISNSAELSSQGGQ